MSRKLREELNAVLSKEEMAKLVSSYDLLGEMAIVEIPASLTDKETQIAGAIMRLNKRVKFVAKRVGRYCGEFRTVKHQTILGEAQNEIEIVESGVRFLLNPQKVYFSPRMGNERRRIASLVQQGEDVLVMFSGIAPYPLIISQYSKARSITGVEKNLDAHEYAKKSLQLNKSLRNVVLHGGDVSEILPHLDSCFDRVVMVLPIKGEVYLPHALKLLKPGGHLHFYDMQFPERFGDSIEKVTISASVQHRRVAQSTVTKCGHCGPQCYRVCVDATIL